MKTLPYEKTVLPKDELISRLLAERPLPLQCEKSVLDALEYNTDNWVRTWIDTAHTIEHRSGRIKASRAITQSGRLIWMIQMHGNRFAFHADRDPVEDAFRQASEARRARKAIAARWPEIVKLRRRILIGTEGLTVSIDDARHAGLCELGIQGFLHRVGLGGRTHFPGRVLAVLSFMDRQVGYAIFAGHLRQRAERSGSNLMWAVPDEH
ncbi:hypothetical protein [uncultured Roseobacter sp.]|uniref:hypothetical protein n=1 Tax=uncultured Roseobacter sp. TaxID=114847 RepID=UPI002601ADAE|nr:hypothetical protein [uncultured Roseobacter sp.]